MQIRSSTVLEAGQYREGPETAVARDLEAISQEVN